MLKAFSMLEERRHPKLPHSAFSQIAISAVEVTPDLREAKVSWSPDHAPGEGGPDSSAAAIATGLMWVSKAARSALAKRIRLRVRPERASALKTCSSRGPSPPRALNHSTSRCSALNCARATPAVSHREAHMQESARSNPAERPSPANLRGSAASRTSVCSRRDRARRESGYARALHRFESVRASPNRRKLARNLKCSVVRALRAQTNSGGTSNFDVALRRAGSISARKDSRQA